MTQQWNRNKQGKIKNIKKEYNRQLAQTIGQMGEGQEIGPGFQQFRSQADQAIGATVGDVQRGMAQGQLAAGEGYSGFQQEGARQAGEGQLAQTANLLSQYKQQQDQAALARQQAAQSGLQYERATRREDRREAVQTHNEIVGTITEAVAAVGDIIPM